MREALPLSLLRTGGTGKQLKKKSLDAHRDRAIRSLKQMLRTLADVEDDVWHDALQQRLITRLEHLRAKHGQLYALTTFGHSAEGRVAACAQ